MSEFETTILMKPEAFVYRIPPRTSNRGFRYADRYLIVKSIMIMMIKKKKKNKVNKINKTKNNLKS